MSTSPIHARVRVGGHETCYLSQGQGQPVLLLHGSKGAQAVFEVLNEILGGRHRVILPEVTPAEAQATSVWLRSLLDGLGLPPVALVAQGDLAMAALTFALLEPDRVSRIVLLQDDLPDQTVREAALGDQLATTGHPLLVVRRTQWQPCPPAVREAAARFFATGRDPAA